MWLIVTDPVAWSVGRSVTLVSPAKTAAPIEMPFGLRTRVGPRNHVLNSDVKSRGSVLPQDSLESVLRCLGLGLGLGMVSWVKKQDSLTTRHSGYQSRK